MYNINKLDIVNGTLFLSKDSNNREIKFYSLKDTCIVNKLSFYPNVKLYSYIDDKIYDPINEKIMSLKSLNSDSTINFSPKNKKDLVVVEDEVFFFVYNTDNYYHFLYDSLPYLITYLELSKNKKIKLLINYPNHQSKTIYNFVKEFLTIVGISDKDIIFINNDTLYKNILISDSYTHGMDSNIPPRSEIYNFYKKIANSIDNNNALPKKIYISRRSWIHGDYSNIGTNYTSRRSMVNEDSLVDFLKSKGYTEIFTELLDTKEKISLFKNATHVVGSIGGGMANVLFSNSNCKVLVICSPGFLEINERFKYSFSIANTQYYKKTRHVDDGEFLKYMRVRCGEIVGEIISVDQHTVTIAYLEESIAGWNNSLKYKNLVVDKKQCEKLDNGLNSPYEIDIKEFKEYE